MEINSLLLVIATLFCGLTTGLVFAFANVVMPGIRTLSDREFLTAFKAMDRVIQDNDPLFLLVWVGSVVLVIAAGVMNFTGVSGIAQILLILAVVAYILGVQLPTVIVNVPLNNRLQAADVDALDKAGLRTEREVFEARWVYWNVFRTVCGLVTTGLLLVVGQVS